MNLKVKKKKITATALKIGSIKGKITGVKASKLLPAAKEEGEEEIRVTLIK